MTKNDGEVVDKQLGYIPDLSEKFLKSLKGLQTAIKLPEVGRAQYYGISKNLPMSSILELGAGQKAVMASLSENISKIQSSITPALSKTIVEDQLNNFSNALFSSKAFENIKSIQLSQVNAGQVATLKSLNAISNIYLPTDVKNSYLKLGAYSAVSNINFNSLFSGLQNLDFGKFWEKLNIETKDYLAKCLKFDIYLPFKVFDDVIPIPNQLNSQEEADVYLKELLEAIDDDGKSIFDLIPDENFDTDKEKLKFLYERKYFKLLLLSCFERIEYIINQLKEKYLGKKSTERSKINETVRDTLKKMQEDNVEDIELTELINSIFQLKKFNEKGFLQFNLFKSFDKNKEILDRLSRNEPPLNRNLAFHGHITDEMATELLANKALLCFGFFATLYNY